MDTYLLKNFLVLSRTKNFTKAALLLGRSQSAISLQVLKLEELLGQKLFIRDKRHVHLTVEGEQLVGYAQRILQIEEEMIQNFLHPVLQGEVNFGTPEDLATAYLPGILANFMESYPQVVLNVNCAFTVDLIQGFEKQLYDVVLIKQDPQHPHPKSQAVWKESLAWVCCKEKKNFDWKKESLPLVLSPAPCVYRKRAIDALNKAGIQWRVVYTSPSLTGTIAAVKAGLGISVLSSNMIPKDLEIVHELPVLQDAQIALLRQSSASAAAHALTSYVLSQAPKQANKPVKSPPYTTS